jgi:ATP-dependent RNA helicase RhlE
MTFDELNLNTPLLNALQDMGFERPTTIQAKAFSVVMSGRDVVGIAQTGTGKTIAYLLPYLRQWKYSKDKVPQILILVPTRELVAQVVDEIVKLGKYISISAVGVYGGSNINTQIATVSEGADILVATPGRLIDLTMKGVVKLKPIKKLVIDEVDEMLSLGFRSQLTMILDLLPLKRQNILFSATMTDEVEALINQYFNQPIKVEAAPAGSPLSNINQVAFEVQNFNTKLNLLRLLLYNDAEMKKVLVFAATKQLADKLFADIAHLFHDQVGIIHSNKSQNHRFNSVKQFHEGNIRILIATDVVARGIDVSEVSHVINFDVPDVAENYVHRIGRTGRADKKGNAILFFTPKEMDAKAQLEALMNFDIPIEPLPENLILSDVLTLNEMPKVYQPNLELKNPRKQTSGAAFHEKKDSNKKTPNKIRHADKMKMKYGKPKTRGQKKK